MTLPTDISPNQLSLFPGEPEYNIKFDEASKSTTVNPVPDKYFVHPEWCYQFFDNEPVVFAVAKESGEEAKTPLQIVLAPVEGSGINFKSNGMVFKIFAREISEASKLELQKEDK